MSELTRGLLTPLSWLYQAVVGARNRHYDRPANQIRARIPVVSVGNLTVGGTGKTPIVSWIARELLACGRRPAVISRGYGGSAGRGPVVVSRGEGPIVDGKLVGDEPFLMAHTLHGVSVVVGSDRPAGVEAAAAFGADIAILDDGFQHRRLSRDLDIVLVDSSDPFGGSRLLPAGRLREPLASLARADLILLTRSRSVADTGRLEEKVRHYQPVAPILLSDHDRVGFVDRAGRPVEPFARAVAFCGIGNPARFRADLERDGLELVEFRPFPDHHVYSQHELDSLAESARLAGATPVTTEKDLARMVGCRRSLPAAISALRIEAVIERPDPLRELLGDLR